MCRRPLTRNTEVVVAQNLFRGAGVEDRQSADLGAEGVHFRAVQGPSGFLDLVFEGVNHGITERHARSLADLLSQTVGGRILDVQRTPPLLQGFSLAHTFYCKAIPRDIPE